MKKQITEEQITELMQAFSRAEEVDKLRVENEGLRAQLEERYISMRVRQLEGALDAERQTVRRLRKALRDIADDCDDHYPPSHGAIKYAARDALEGKP